MQYPVEEWLPTPVLHPVTLEQGESEHAADRNTRTHSPNLDALPLSFVSLPQPDFLSVSDGLQVACISCPAFALMFPLLAEHIEMSGGTVDYGDEDAG